MRAVSVTVQPGCTVQGPDRVRVWLSRRWLLRLMTSQESDFVSPRKELSLPIQPRGFVLRECRQMLYLDLGLTHSGLTQGLGLLRAYSQGAESSLESISEFHFKGVYSRFSSYSLRTSRP